MYDCHYDLLTYVYMNKNNLKEVKEYCNNIFKNNIKGGIFNLFYMSEKEMKEELNIKQEEIDIIENLKEVKTIIKKENLIPKNMYYKIGIEGLDYLQEIEDVDVLYNLGVRSVNPVWNNHNKFGTGVRPIEQINKEKGLTDLGRSLIKKLIQTGIAIDLSHADEQTFWDIIEECRKYKKLKPKVFASHSNCKAICDVPRNLNNEQIKAIREFNGIIGVVSIKQFVSEHKTEYKQEYIEHINYLKEMLNGVKNIALATDNMSYYIIKPEYYKKMNVFNHATIDEEITQLLSKNNYIEGEINAIKEENFTNFWR